jgi:hypothetical protein
MDEIMLVVEFQISPFQLPWIGLNYMNDENQTYIIEIGQYEQNRKYR